MKKLLMILFFIPCLLAANWWHRCADWFIGDDPFYELDETRSMRASLGDDWYKKQVETLYVDEGRKAAFGRKYSREKLIYVGAELRRIDPFNNAIWAYQKYEE